MTSRTSEVFLDVTAELLSRGHRVRFRAEGDSMHPTIRGGEAIMVKPVPPGELKNGDIVLYQAQRGVTAHRLVRIEGQRFLMRGDAPGSAEEPVEQQQILGKVVSLERAGHSIDLRSRKAKMKNIVRIYASHVRSRVSAALASCRHAANGIGTVRSLLTLLLVALAFQGAARAAVAVVGTPVSAVGDQKQTYGVALTPGAGANYLVVGVSGTGQRAGVAITVTSIKLYAAASCTGTAPAFTCTGTAKETLASNGNIQQGTNGARADIWSTPLVAGDLVSDVVYVTLGGTASDETLMGAVVLSGVATVSSFQSTSGTTGTTASLPAFTNFFAGSMIIDTLGRNAAAGNPAVASSQTSRWNINTGTTAGTDALGAGSTLALPLASSPATVSWTLNQGSTSATWAYGAVLVTPSGVTAVQVSSLTASPSGSGNLIKLQTGREVNNLGFNLYREQNGQRVKLNSSLLAGSAFLGGAGTTFTAGHTRTWQDDVPGGSGSAAYWVEEIDLSGASTWYGPVSPDSATPSTSGGIGTAASRAFTRAALRGGAPSSAPAVSLSSIGSSATTSTAAVTVAAAATATPQNLQTQWTLAAGQALKLGVTSEGWYRVTQPQLVAVGLNPNVNPHNLQLYVNGVQQPIQVEGQSDGKFESDDAIDFYGLGINTIWSGTQEYWLVAGNGAGLRISTEAKSNGSAGASSFPFSVQWQPRTIYFAALLNGDGNNFFGPVLDSGDPLSQTITVTHLNTATAGSSPLQVTLQGGTAGAHAVTVSLNGNFVGNMAFSDQNSSTSSFLVPDSYLQEGANTLGMTVTGGATDVSVVDTVLLTYPHSYIADSNSLRMTAASGRKVIVSGFSGSVQVIDITNPSSVHLVPSTVSAGAVAFVPQGGGTRTLLAVASSQFASPVSITANHPSSWHSAQTGGDMVIISHASLMSEVAPLASLRQSQSHTVKVIDVQDLYDEFNFGVESPYAIQSFLSTAKANWSTKPAYVLLMGNGTFDPRNYLGTTVPDLVPAKLVDTNLLETASDDWFADFNNDGIPEMAIGRIPAETVSDATNAVNRLIAYDQSGGGGWKNQALLVAGVDQDPTDNFEGFTASVAALLPASVTATQILAGSDPLAHTDVMAGLNAGQSLVNYVGHGSNEVWADGLLSSTDAAGLTNGSMTPLVLSMTCLNGYFQDLYTNPLAKALLNASSGGAVAVWASSGLTDASPQSNLNQSMVSALYGATGTTIGKAAMAAKAATSDINVRRTWILFGDPAMKLQ